MYKCVYASKIGNLTLVSDGYYLHEILFENNRYPSKYVDAIEDDTFEIFIKTKKWLDDYFNHKQPILDLPIVLEGTVFQKEVWKVLATIPYGTVVTYGDIARKMNCKAYQAIGVAVGKNPLGILLPCHRVIGVNGNLVGFGGGLDIKIELLKHEGVDVTKLKRPAKGNAL